MKILMIGDSPLYNTGFANVLRTLADYFVSLNHQVKIIGWHYKNEDYDCNKYKYKIIPSQPYGIKELCQILETEKFDLLFTLADLFMIEEIPAVLNKYNYKMLWMAYFPIDSFPIHSKHRELIKRMDFPITYSEFGINAVKEIVYNLNIEYIPHGLHFEKYKQLDKEKTKAEYNLQNKFVVGYVGTNQIRKQIDRLLMGFKKSICFSYDTENCKECFRDCGINKIQSDNSVLYLHTQLNNSVGYDLVELVKRYKLEKLVHITNGINYVKGLDEISYNKLLNIFDVLVLPSQGEGCGLPILEGSYLGIPVLSQGYSAIEYNPEKNNLIKIKDYILDIELSTQRALIDTDDLANKIISYRTEYFNNGTTVNGNYTDYIRKNFDWKIQLLKFKELLNKI